MRKDIHPTYYEDAVITCACGATYKTGSTVKELSIEICSSCHPFYTGKKKYVDTTGRVERFKALTEKSLKQQESRRKSSIKKTASKEEKIPKEKSAVKK